MRAIVCLKQVVDPLTPAASLVLDAKEMKIRVGASSPPVINGFDEQGLEAALRLREAIPDLEIVCLAAGERFNNDVMKRAFAVGADQLVLIQDPSLDTWDPYTIATVLAAAIRHIGGGDLIICGRQGSDWDNGLTPFILADSLAMPLITLAKRVSAKDARSIEVERALADGTMVMAANLPAIVTVTSELGALRMPSVAARLTAARKQPRQLTLNELGMTPSESPAPVVTELAIPMMNRNCTFIDAAGGADAGARLAETLLDAGAVRLGGES
jgi:electron transfer flavoprotein beta subunit